jgi:hypothetical protein
MPEIKITQDDLRAALQTWEIECRKGGFRTRDEVLTMTPKNVAQEGVAYLWPVLMRVVEQRQ